MFWLCCLKVVGFRSMLVFCLGGKLSFCMTFELSLRLEAHWVMLLSLSGVSDEFMPVIIR